jgi:glycosyltransferase involved in cell wall biosynthesis
MNKKHILFASYDGMTDSLGQSQVLPYIKEISKYNYSYSLISFEKKDKFEKHKKSIQEICNTHNINWLPIPYSSKIPIISTIWNVIKLKFKVFHLHKTKPIDLIHSRSHIPSIVSQQLQIKNNIPYIFDMRGFWADERVDGGVWKLRNPIYKFVFNFFKKKEIQFITEANGIISLTENGKNEILSWQKIESVPEKLKTKKLDIEVIPCCVDTTLFNIENINEERKKELKKQLSILDNQYVIGYVGSIGTWYMLSEMLDFFHELLNFKPNSIFLFVSNEPEEKIIKEVEIRKIPLTSIRVISCLHHDVPQYISLFDVSIYFILPAYSKKASSPTKQGELMSLGIPIICNANVGDSDKIILETDSGWVVNEFEKEAYISVIQSLSKTFNKDHIIHTSYKIFDLKRGAMQFKNMYDKVLNPKI